MLIINFNANVNKKKQIEGTEDHEILFNIDLAIYRSITAPHMQPSLMYFRLFRAMLSQYYSTATIRLKIFVVT